MPRRCDGLASLTSGSARPRPMPRVSGGAHTSSVGWVLARPASVSGFANDLVRSSVVRGRFLHLEGQCAVSAAFSSFPWR
jgi:hypothetical protein